MNGFKLVSPSTNPRWFSSEAAVDWLLVMLVVTITLGGWLMLMSASHSFAQSYKNTPWFFAQRQGLYILLSVLVMWLVVQFSVEHYRRYRGLLFLSAIVLLFVVLLMGTTVKGATRWLNLGVLNFQPAEWVKLSTIIFLAGYLAKYQAELSHQMVVITRLSIPFGLIGFLLTLQPDLGSQLVIGGIAVGMILVSTAPVRYVLYILVPMIAILSILIFTGGYSTTRMLVFLDPWADPFGDGYQIIQSFIAYGEGGVWGVGLGNSMQKLLFLPDAHTDFLFSVYAEEFGLVGVMLAVGLFGWLFMRMLIIADRAKAQDNMFANLLVIGIALWIMIQVAINMGMSMGLLPTKGLTLPLVSYGGSSLLMTAIAIGIVLRVDMETRLIHKQSLQLTS